ncbi:PH domain-containing protein [Hydrogenivirga sp.]
MPSYEEIVKQMESLDGIEKLLVRKEIKELPNILREDEKIEAVVQGIYNDRNGLLIATNERLIFIDKSLLGKVKVEEFPYEKVTSVKYEKGWFLGSVKIYASGNTAEIEQVIKKKVQPFVDKVNELIKSYRGDAKNRASFVDELAKLAELLEKGLITEEEFKKAKAKLLNG